MWPFHDNRQQLDRIERKLSLISTSVSEANLKLDALINGSLDKQKIQELQDRLKKSADALKKAIDQNSPK